MTITTAYEHSISVPQSNNTKFEVCILSNEVIIAHIDNETEEMKHVVLTLEQAHLLRNHLNALQEAI